jgi:hypothetical protein
LGFPHKYGSNVLRCIAYDAYNRSNTFLVNLNVPLEDRVGFYGVEIDFSQGPPPQVFSVEFVLSNNLLTQDPENATLFNLDFPTFPSLTKSASVCNSSIVLPEGTQYVWGTVSAFAYSQENLPAFTYNGSDVTFLLADEEIQLFDMKQLSREITISEFGEIATSDSYYLANRAPTTINFVEVTLPPNVSSDPIAQDQLGRTMDKPVLISSNPSRYRINLTLPMEVGRNARFTVSYGLSSEAYVKPQAGANNFAVVMTFFQEVNYYVDQVSVVFVLPEGAKLVSLGDSSASGPYGVGRGAFQTSVTINRQGVSFLDSFAVGITYEYNPLWLAFRPTMWIWALAIVGCAVVVVWQRPKAPVGVAVPSAALRLRPESIRSFVESYQEKMKIASEIDSLEAKVQKGKIPRRRYKVQTKTLETRLSTLSRSLAEFGEKARAAGGHYANLMRQLEIAETEINEAEANVKSIEARHSRGEISLETYRKLLGDYQRRKEKAETSINGILLRLREEIH